jgi:flavin-dependent dehydrogenase
MKQVDVAILGAGPAGSATALALCGSGLTTLLVDRPRDSAQIGETLPPAIKKLLFELGVWERFLTQEHLPSHSTCAIWGQEGAHCNDFLFSPYGPGWHIERARFDGMLRSAAIERGTAFVQGTPDVARRPDAEGGWRLVIDHEGTLQEVHARILVDATGRASALGRCVAGRKVASDRLIGVIGFFELSAMSGRRHHRSETLIEASRCGWWYAAEVPGARLVVTYMTDADLFARANRSDPHHWRTVLEETVSIRRWTRGLREPARPIVVAANSARLPAAAGRDWLAVGDAAMTLDPLSSQGIYAALESGLEAARAIGKEFAGDRLALARYSTWVERRFAAHLRGQHYYYPKEQRWALSEFWSRRLGGAA